MKRNTRLKWVNSIESKLWDSNSLCKTLWEKRKFVSNVTIISSRSASSSIKLFIDFVSIFRFSTLFPIDWIESSAKFQVLNIFCHYFKVRNFRKTIFLSKFTKALNRKIFDLVALAKVNYRENVQFFGREKFFLVKNIFFQEQIIMYTFLLAPTWLSWFFLSLYPWTDWKRRNICKF